MRRLLLLLSLSLCVAWFPHAPAAAQPYPPGYYPPPPPPPPYPHHPRPYQGGPALSPNNCGTPDEPKPCPPMPTHPLPYYPPNRQ